MWATQQVVRMSVPVGSYRIRILLDGIYFCRSVATVSSAAPHGTLLLFSAAAVLLDDVMRS